MEAETDLTAELWPMNDLPPQIEQEVGPNTPDKKPPQAKRGWPLKDYIFSKDNQQQAKNVETWTSRELRKTARTNKKLLVWAITATVVVILQAGALWAAIPLVRILPVFFHIKPDGVLETAITSDSLPGRLADAGIQSSLWQYVQHREAYSWVEQDLSNKIVQAMSALPVREVYREFSSGKNPQSYLAKLGQKGVIRVQLREVINYMPSTGGLPGHITFHYDRCLYMQGEPPPKSVTYTASLEFVQNYRTGFDIRDVIAFNPFRIVVTEYPGSYELPAVKGLAQCTA